MNNFYGGQPGKDFRLAYIFKNKKEALEDLNKGIVSTIGVGEYVVISYGDVDSEEYVANFNEDGGKKSYNGCFYKKDYETNEAKIGSEDLVKGGWVYRFICRMTGPIPRFEKNVEITYENIAKPEMAIDSTNPDKPVLSGVWPKPDVTTNISPTSGFNIVLAEQNNGVNGMWFNFTIPHAKIAEYQIVDSTTNPDVAVNEKLQFSFKLPKGVEMHQVESIENIEGINGDLYFVTATGYVYQYLNDAFVFLWDLIPELKTSYCAHNQNMTIELTLSEDNGYQLNFTIPETPKFSIEAQTLETGVAATAKLEEVENGYKIKLGLPKGNTGDKGDKGDSLIIWSAREPLEFVGIYADLSSIKEMILNYLTENIINYPDTTGQLLPITYIYDNSTIPEEASIAMGDSTNDIVAYEENDVQQENLFDIKLVNTTNEPCLFVEKTILGFFAYYDTKWNIFLAPNGGGGNNLEWEGEF